MNSTVMLGTDANQRDIRFFFVVVVPIAQLVRAPDCGSGGRGFESRWAPFFTHLQRVLRLSVLPEPGFFLCGPTIRLACFQRFKIGTGSRVGCAVDCFFRYLPVIPSYFTGGCYENGNDEYSDAHFADFDCLIRIDRLRL